MPFTSEQIRTLRTFGQRIVKDLRESVERRPVTKFGAVNASGNLAKSIRYEVDERSLKIYAADYVIYLIDGRPPGTWPNLQSIKDWIIVKGLNFDIPIDSLAFLISRKIYEKGTTIWQQGGSDLVSSVVNNDLINEIQEEMVLKLIEDIRSEVLDLSLVA